MDSTLFTFISTVKATAGASALSTSAAPGGTQGCYIHAGAERIHVDLMGNTATTNSAPIGANGSHYVKASEGQTISYIRGAAADGDVWFTWVKD